MKHKCLHYLFDEIFFSFRELKGREREIEREELKERVSDKDRYNKRDRKR